MIQTKYQLSHPLYLASAQPHGAKHTGAPPFLWRRHGFSRTELFR